MNLGYETLAEVEGAPPTAELEPITENYTQVKHFTPSNGCNCYTFLNSRSFVNSKKAMFYMVD